MYRNDVNDTGLLDAIRTNDTSAFEQIFSRYWHFIYQFSYGKCGSEKTAKEITWKIFIELWENRAYIPTDFSLQGFFTSKIRNYLVAEIHAQLSDQESNSIIDEITSSFSVDNLKSAYTAVSSKHEQKNEAITYTYTPGSFLYEKNMIGKLNTIWKLMLNNISLGIRKTFF